MKSTLGAFALCWMGALAPPVALAQVAPAPGGSQLNSRNETQEGRHLALEWLFQSAYDDDVATANSAGPTDPRLQVGGGFGSLGAGLSYSSRNRRSSVRFDANSTGAYYPDLHEINGVDASTQFGMTRIIGRRGEVSLFQAARYRPYYQMRTLGALSPADPSAPVLPDRSEALTSGNWKEAEGSIRLSRRLGRRNSLTSDYSYRVSALSGRESPFSWQMANVRFTGGLTRFVGLRVGYGYGIARDGTQASDPRTTTHNIDLGLDYRRSLSRSRRTTLTVATGGTVVEYLGHPEYRFTIDSGLTRQFGRTWDARVSYQRGVQFVEGFTGPFYAHNVGANLGGRVSRRTSLTLSTGYSTGHLGLDVSGSRYTTYLASARYGLAVSDAWTLNAQYFFYRYTFGELAEIPVRLPRELNRNGLRVGLTGRLRLLR